MPIARRPLGIGVIAIGHRPAVRDLPAVEVDASRLADGEQPAVAVALPAGAVDRAAAGQPRQRLPRGAAAGIGRAGSLAGLVVFGSVDTEQPYALALQRDGVAVVDHGIAGKVPGGDAID